jgi:hypothetical protein
VGNEEADLHRRHGRTEFTGSPFSHRGEHLLQPAVRASLPADVKPAGRRSISGRPSLAPPVTSPTERRSAAPPAQGEGSPPRHRGGAPPTGSQHSWSRSQSPALRPRAPARERVFAASSSPRCTLRRGPPPKDTRASRSLRA